MTKEHVWEYALMAARNAGYRIAGPFAGSAVITIATPRTQPGDEARIMVGDVAGLLQVMAIYPAIR